MAPLWPPRAFSPFVVGLWVFLTLQALRWAMDRLMK